MGIFSSSKKTKEEVIFSIGSGSIDAALISIEHGGEMVRVRKSVKEEFVFQESLEHGRLVNSMLSSLSRAAEIIAPEKNAHTEKIIIILGSVWYMSETRLVCYKGKKFFTVSSDLLGTVMDQSWIEEEKKRKDARRKNILIEQSPINFSLNGYETLKPLGKEALEMEVSVFFSTASADILYGIEDSIDKYFVDVPIVPHSSALVFFIGLREKIGFSYEDFFIIHIGAEVTEVILVKSGALLEVVSFPFGSNTMVRSVASIMRLPPSEASSILMWGEREGNEKLKDKLASAIKRPKEDWLSFFRHTLADLIERHGILPVNAYLIPENHIDGIRYGKFLADEPLEHALYCRRHLRVISLDADEIRNSFVFAVSSGKRLKQNDFFAMEPKFA